MLTSDIGPSDAKILLIGEAPGADEEKQGIPFCGSSGRLLKQMLSHVGIDFNSCYVTNVSNERPPGNEFGYFYEDLKRNTPKPSLESRWFLLREKVTKIRPNLVICLGAESIRALTGKRGIDSWRGTVILYNGIKVIPTYHPAAVLRQYDFHAICEMDFEKARVESLIPEYQPVPINTSVCYTVTDVLSLTNVISGLVAFDIETVGELVRCISLAYKINGVVCSSTIPFIKFNSSSMVFPSNARVSMIPNNQTNASCYWSIEDEVEVVGLLKKLMEDKSIRKISHNGISFDQPIIEKNFGITVENHYFDTMHAFHVLYPELPKGLDFLSSIYTNIHNYWSNVDKTNDIEEWKYCAYDSAVTFISYEHIQKDLVESNLDAFYFNRTHRAALVVSKAQQHGVLLDKEKLKEKALAMEKLLEETQKEIDTIAGSSINIDSPKQVQSLLYEKLRFPTVSNEAGRPTVDVDALNALKVRYPSERILSAIIDHRSNRTIYSTFLTDKSDLDGRARTSYNVSGTKNGRLSSQANRITNTGYNLQNFPKDVRDIFIADEGFSFVKGDLSQAEARVVAEILCRHGDLALHNKFLEPSFDIHKWMGSCITHVKEEDISYKERQLGKLANHSGNYVAGPRVLMRNAPDFGITMDYQEAKRFLDMRMKAIPGLSIWWEDVMVRLRRTRTICNCLGRRRIFFGRIDDTTHRDAVAFEPQSTVADVCNEIFITMSSSLPEDCFTVLQVHDEVTVLVPDAKIELAVETMRKAAKIPLFISGSGYIEIPIDIAVGKNWKDCKEIKN